MKRVVQATGFRESPYERPNQKWVCGWAADGNPCPMGPDARGLCTARLQTECTPSRRGDRYCCTRPVVFGGPCAKGPLPNGSCSHPEGMHAECQPRLSIRAWRGRLAWNSLVLTLGLLILTLGGPWRMRALSPGQLSPLHDPIRGPGGSRTNCSVCHEAGEMAGAGWAARALMSWAHDDQSEKCLACHFQRDPRARAVAAQVHSVTPEWLASVTANLPERGRRRRPLLALASVLISPPARGGETIACATCHREHRRGEPRLTHMTNSQCQVCHTMQFASLANGHPQFKPIALPRSGIQFDHASHAETHFGNAPFECERCHTPDSRRRTMRLEPFERSCAGCHDQGQSDHHGHQIRANSTVLIRLPYMELEDSSVYWPAEAATGDRLNPIMRVLLAGDAGAISALDDLDRAGVDWATEDWTPDDATKAALAKAIGRLIVDLETKSSGGLRQRIATALSVPPEDPAVLGLADQLSAASFAVTAYQRRWLPGLGGRPPSPGTEGGADWSMSDDASGWYIEPDLKAVDYRAPGHADTFLKRWTDALALHANAETDKKAFQSDPRARILNGAFSEMISPKSGGYLYSTCLRCHAVDLKDQRYAINWSPVARPENAIGYAAFVHRPHLTLLKGEDGCLHCHEIAKAAAGEGLTVIRGIAQEKRETCAECHTPGQVNADCLTCHNYHFGRP